MPEVLRGRVPGECPPVYSVVKKFVQQAALDNCPVEQRVQLFAVHVQGVAQATPDDLLAEDLIHIGLQLRVSGELPMALYSEPGPQQTRVPDFQVQPEEAELLARLFATGTVLSESDEDATEEPGGSGGPARAGSGRSDPRPKSPSPKLKRNRK